MFLANIAIVFSVKSMIILNRGHIFQNQTKVNRIDKIWNHLLTLQGTYTILLKYIKENEKAEKSEVQTNATLDNAAEVVSCQKESEMIE